MFDDNGVILGYLIKVGNKIYMYYVGFQLVKKSKFLAILFFFLGLIDFSFQRILIIKKSFNCLVCNGIFNIISKEIR